jgi:hypothetical protein
MAIKEEEFRKEIHLPKALKEDLEVMAIREGHGDVKNMIQKRTVAELAAWKIKDIKE